MQEYFGNESNIAALKVRVELLYTVESGLQYDISRRCQSKSMKTYNCTLNQQQKYDIYAHSASLQ